MFSDEYLLLPSGNLQIVSVTPEHQGMYKCGAYNPVTRETRAEAHGTKVVVKGKDNFLMFIDQYQIIRWD